MTTATPQASFTYETITLHEKVPRTASGKILRRELADRERAQSATP